MYDDATGERVELSVATFDNWVCKLANLFGIEWGLDPGERLAVLMPAHWQSMVAMVAAWTSGQVVALDPATPVAASVVGPASRSGPRVERWVLGCSLRPFGRAETAPLPPGWLDFASEVPPQPDALLTAAAAAGPADSALVGPAGLVSHAEIVERALASADELGLAPGGRLLTDLNPTSPEGLDVALLAPLATGSSVVLLLNATEQRRIEVASQEQVTCRRWSDG